MNYNENEIGMSERKNSRNFMNDWSIKLPFYSWNPKRTVQLSRMIQ